MRSVFLCIGRISGGVSLGGFDFFFTTNRCCGALLPGFDPKLVGQVDDSDHGPVKLCKCLRTESLRSPISFRSVCEFGGPMSTAAVVSCFCVC